MFFGQKIEPKYSSQIRTQHIRKQLHKKFQQNRLIEGGKIHGEKYIGFLGAYVSYGIRFLGAYVSYHMSPGRLC